MKKNFTKTVNLILLLLITFSGINIAQDWKCIIYGDTRNDKPEHKQVLQSMQANTPDFKFIINVGDVVDHGDNDSEWADWYTTFTSVLDSTGQNSVPPMFMSTPGNHDATETVNGLKNWNKYLSGQNELYCTDDLPGRDGKYFTFDYENVRFLIMDADKSPVEGDQLTMLNNAVENNPQQWLIAIWHDPIFDFGEKSYEGEFHEKWGVPLYNAGCDFVFMGDAHYYVRNKKLKLNGEKNPPLDSLNGTVQIVAGNGGASMDIPVPDHDNNGYMVASHSTTKSHFGYSELHFKNDTLYYKHIFRDGTIYDEAVYLPNIKIPTNVKKTSTITNYSLIQNYPNPFNPSTVISFEIPDANIVSLVIYDTLGRKVKELISDKNYSAGFHSVQWNGTDNNGNNISNGVYIYELKAGSFKHSLKAILMK